MYRLWLKLCHFIYNVKMPWPAFQKITQDTEHVFIYKCMYPKFTIFCWNSLVQWWSLINYCTYLVLLFYKLWSFKHFFYIIYNKNTFFTPIQCQIVFLNTTKKIVQCFHALHTILTNLYQRWFFQKIVYKWYYYKYCIVVLKNKM